MTPCRRWLLALPLLLAASLTCGCNVQLPSTAFDWTYRHGLELTDHPDRYKGKEVTIEVEYDGGGSREDGRLTDFIGTVFTRNGHFDIAFTIPKEAETINLQPSQKCLVTFIFSGNVTEPSKVVRITRK